MLHYDFWQEGMYGFMANALAFTPAATSGLQSDADLPLVLGRSDRILRAS